MVWPASSPPSRTWRCVYFEFSAPTLYDTFCFCWASAPVASESAPAATQQASVRATAVRFVMVVSSPSLGVTILRRYDSRTMNKNCRLLAACFACCIAGANAQDVNPSAALGKQRAAASKLEWETRD